MYKVRGDNILNTRTVEGVFLYEWFAYITGYFDKRDEQVRGLIIEIGIFKGVAFVETKLSRFSWRKWRL